MSTFLFYFFTFVRRSRRRCSTIKKVFLKNIAIFIGKHLCANSFFNKVAGLLKSNYFRRQKPRDFCEFRTFLRKFITWNTLIREFPKIFSSEIPLKWPSMEVYSEFPIAFLRKEGLLPIRG